MVRKDEEGKFLGFFDRADLKIMSYIGRGPKTIGADDVIRTHDPQITKMPFFTLFCSINLNLSYKTTTYIIRL